ncbi:MAG: BCCT family transporter [Rickettsiales bacterium]|nr:BCCT family transporter [Rickettsiales bacterium]
MVFKRLHPAHFLLLIIVIIAAISPFEMRDWLQSYTRWFEHRFGWLVLLICAYFVGLSFYIALGRYGSLKLGGPDAEPQFHTLSWLAMLFAAGMGSGLVFYGAAEPLLHYLHPPPVLQDIPEGGARARHALMLSHFHWGIHAWAIYAIAALSVAYFTFEHDKKLLPSTPLSHGRSEQTHRIVSLIVNSFAILAVVFGIVGSLSQGVLQVSQGVLRWFGTDTFDAYQLKLMVLASLFTCYLVSASTGISRGIKVLSDINIIVAILLMLFIMFAGPTQFIVESLVSGIGDYLGSLSKLSFNVRHFSDAGGWTEEWTINYFLWWVAWAPFVGIFIARISRGRSLREFILGVIFVPTLFSALWFSTLGGTALHLELFSDVPFEEVIETPEAATYALMEQLPFAEITFFVVIALLFIFLVTSADSGTFVLGMFTSDGKVNPGLKQRLFWGIIIGALTLATISMKGGISLNRSIAVAGGAPFLFIMLWQSIRLLQTLRSLYPKTPINSGQ